MTTEQKETFTAENDALLVEKTVEAKDAKRNSKQELIQRILDWSKKTTSRSTIATQNLNG